MHCPLASGLGTNFSRHLQLGQVLAQLDFETKMADREVTAQSCDRDLTEHEGKGLLQTFQCLCLNNFEIQ